MKDQATELSTLELTTVTGGAKARLPETEIAKTCFRDNGQWWSREYEAMKLGFQVPCDLK